MNERLMVLFIIIYYFHFILIFWLFIAFIIHKYLTCLIWGFLLSSFWSLELSSWLFSVSLLSTLTRNFKRLSMTKMKCIQWFSKLKARIKIKTRMTINMITKIMWTKEKMMHSKKIRKDSNSSLKWLKWKNH